MLKKLAVVVVCIIVSLCASAFAAEMNYSADVETKSQDTVMNSKYYVKGQKMRIEMQGRSGFLVALVRYSISLSISRPAAACLT